MTSTFIWDRFSDHDQAVFAPDVPLEQRREPEPGLLSWAMTLRRFRKRWEGRVVLLGDLANAHHVREVRKACEGVWWAAKPLAGVVDLHELEYQLNDELWTCAQLVIQLAAVSREVPNESPARKVILDQIADRKGQLAQLRTEYEALYAENGADPATVTDAVREALLHAQALNEHRPIADTVAWTQSLREIVARYRTQTEQAEQTPES